MRKYRFAMVGGGWRGEFFARIARMMPDTFELVGTWLRSPDKREAWKAKYGGVMTDRMADLADLKPDFIVMAIKKTESTPVLMDLVGLYIPVLCETPPAIRAEDLTALWQRVRETGTPVQVAEQYPYQPHYAAYKQIIDRGMIGEITDLNLSTVHSYHAVAVARFLLSLGYENAVMRGERVFLDVQQCAGRYGYTGNGEVVAARRDRVSFRFDSGKYVFFDFTAEQYHSPIRNRHILIRGRRGEIFDDKVYFLNQAGFPVEETIKRHDIGINNNQSLYLHGISVGADLLYTNPFPWVRFNDDEVAVAECMKRMGEMCVEHKGTVYDLREGLQDAYFAVEMEKVLTAAAGESKTADQPWKREPAAAHDKT